MPNLNLRQTVALLLFFSAIMIGTKYKEILVGFNADPVPFILTPILLVGAWYIMKKFGHKIPNTKNDPPRKDDTGDQYNG